MADTEQAVIEFKHFLDKVAAKSAPSVGSNEKGVLATPTATTYEIVLARFMSRLDDDERAQLVLLFRKMTGGMKPGCYQKTQVAASYPA